MEPSLGPMDIERNSYDIGFFATHVIEKQQDKTGKWNLQSKAVDQPQDKPRQSAVIGRLYQWYMQDNSSPDAINQVFQQHFENILEETYRSDDPNDLRDLQGRLSHLIDNAKTFEAFKTRLFSNTVVTPVGLTSLTTLIEKAEARKKLVESHLTASPRMSPRIQELEHLNVSIMASFNRLLRYDPQSMVGIFRIQGDDNNVEVLRAGLTKQTHEELEELLKKEQNPHNVAKAIARVIRNLDPPLISNDFYPFFIAVNEGKSPEEKVMILKHAIGMLPPGNQAVLLSLINALKELRKMENITKMDVHNLAICWAPNLLISPKDKLLEDFQAVNSVTELMIKTDLSPTPVNPERA